MNNEDKAINITVTESFWTALAENENLWYSAAFSAFPSVIAHEYKRLQDELEQDRPFAAMLQLKDVLEALLKFEVLLAYAWAGQSGISQFREKVECIITTRSLSMGAWMELAKEIVNFFKRGKMDVSMPDPMYRPLSLVRKFYNKHEFVNWRNEAVGHGALAFSEDEAFRKDIHEKLQLIRQLFEEIAPYLKEQNIQTDGGKLILMGAGNARNLPLEEGKVLLVNEAQNLCFELSPYMYIREGSIYFFDNQKKPSRTQRLCYTTGGRRNEENAYFSRLDAIREEQGLKMDLEASSGYIVVSEEKFLNRLGMEAGFVEPKHLISWLQKEVSQADKGVFLLKMPRGTGKSTFAEKLNRLYDGPLEVSDDMDVRTYHLSRTQVRSGSDFERGIETQWSLAYQQETWTAYTRMVDYRNEGSEPAEAFAEYLRQVLDFTDGRRDKDRILMVIDGLDEIAEPAIWEYIPRAEQLADGVYILLTSRDPEQEKDLPEGLGERLNRLDIQGGMTVCADSPENIEFLKRYANRDGTIQKNQIDRLLELAGNRVLYLGMYLTLLRGGLKLKELPEAQKLCGRFIGEIEKKYGEKKAQRLRRILCVLSGVGRFEPLSLKEIAELSDEGGVTFELLGMMNDLRSIMKANRGYIVGNQWYMGENRYELVNEDVAKSIFDLLPGSKQQAKGSVIDVLKETEDMPEEEKITDGMLLTLAYAAELLEMAGENERELPELTYKQGINLLSKLTNRFEHQALILERLEKAHFQLLDLYQNDWEPSLRAYLWNELKRIYNGKRVIWEELDAAGRLTDRNCLAIMYNNMAYSLCSQHKLTEALEMYNKAQAILENPDRNCLAIMYNNMAYSLCSQQKFSEALEMCDKARVIQEELDSAGMLMNRSFLAGTYNNMARALESQQKLTEALSMYDKARAIQEELDAVGRLTDREDLAIVYNNMAGVLESQQKHTEALSMYDKARTIQEELDAAGRLTDREDLAIVYNNMAGALESQQKHTEALSMYDKARTIQEELDAAGRLKDRTQLVAIYGKAEEVLKQLGREEEAREYRRKAEAVRKQMDAPEG